jgi:hypothetical protein
LAGIRAWEVTDMQRYLLVLDMDLLAVDEKFDLEPINYLVAQQEREPCEVVFPPGSGTAELAVRRVRLVVSTVVRGCRWRCGRPHLVRTVPLALATFM